MESFLPSEIARLVLGYLEDHKCEEAYETFLRTSPHLEECLKMREEGRKFRTHLMGLGLLDILYEYSAVFSLIQERLKKVDPETASSLKSSGSLLDKITFLLNATGSGQTMLFSITLPPGKSPSTVAHVRKRLRTASNSDKRKDLRKRARAHIEEFSPIIELDENMIKSSTLDTTSLSSLPGNTNICLDHTGQLIGTPKRKAHSLNSIRRSRANSVIPEDSDENLDLTALTKALLDNHELHEKIAEKINKVISTPELGAGTNISQQQDLCSAHNPLLDTNLTFPNNFTLELDNAIKKIVEETECDPVFENFLQDVCPADESSEDGDDRGISETSTPETAKKLTLKHRLRSSKKRNDSPNSIDINIPTKIEHQNLAAIESIISMQTEPKDKEPEPSTSGLQKRTKKENENNTVPQITITDTNILPLTVQTNSVENIQSRISPQVVITESLGFQPVQDRLVILTSKITSTGSQILTVQPAQLQTNTEDILSMPAVIINDENHFGNTFVVPHKTFPTLESIMTIDRANEPAPVQSQPKPSKPPVLLPHPLITTHMATIPMDPITYTLNVPLMPSAETTFLKTVDNNLNLKQNPIETSNPSTSKEVVARSVPMISLSSEKKEDKIEKSVTPEISASKVQKLSLSSPRTSRSHIRALDFSTPFNDDCPKLPLTSPKSLRKDRRSQRQSRSLFTSPLNVPIATRSPHTKLQGDWDGTDIIFVNKPTKKKLEAVEDMKEAKKPEARCKRALSMNPVSNKPLIIDEAEISVHPIRSKKFNSWDQDLRLHIETIPMDIKKKKTSIKKTVIKKRSKTEQKVEVEDENGTVNNTEEDGLSIEVELAKMESDNSSLSSSKENEETQKVIEKQTRQISKNSKEIDIKAKETENKPTEGKSAKVKRRRATQINTKSVVQKTETVVKEEPSTMKEEVPTKKEEAPAKKEKAPAKKEALANKEPIKNEEAPLKKGEPSSKKEELPTKKEKISITKEEQPTKKEVAPDKVHIFEDKESPPRNMSPRVKNKCNLESSTKKSSPIEDQKSSEDNIIETTSVMSKVDTKSTNEKIFVEDKFEAKESQIITKPSEPSTSDTNSNQSLNTPDTLQPSCSIVGAAARNLTPMLETPMKNSLLCPVTPGVLTPFGTDASFTNLLKQNCANLDFSSIMTPNFPLTPSFPLTPGLGTGDSQSSYASRPTDYSNSSSYYQPSDSEQNKKIDQILIEEAIKMESSSMKKNIYTSTPDKEMLKNKELSVPPSDTMPNSTGDRIKSSNSMVQETKDTVNLSSSFSSDDNQSIENKTEANSTVIHVIPNLRRGGKHMAMLKQLLQPAESYSDSDQSESPEDERKAAIKKRRNATKSKENFKKNDNKETAIEQDKNITKETAIEPVNNVAIPIQSDNKNTKETVIHPKEKNKPEQKKITKIVSSKKPLNSKVTKAHCALLEALEMKRKRIIEELKTTSSKPKTVRKSKGERTPRILQTLKAERLPQILHNSEERVPQILQTTKVERVPKVRKNNVEVSTRVTRSKSVTRNNTESPKEESKKQVKPVYKLTQLTKAKSTTIKRNASIEDVAARLRKDKDKTDVPENEKITNRGKEKEIPNQIKKLKGLILSPTSSFESPDSSFLRDKITPTVTDDEEIPRLHISSDEEDETLNGAIDENNPDIIKELKERGIHLVPKKISEKSSEEPMKDEDDPNIINIQYLDLDVSDTDLEASVDLEDSIPKSTIQKKIEIKSDIYLDESKKIDISKIFTVDKNDKKVMHAKDEMQKIQSEQIIINDKELTEENVETKQTGKIENVTQKEIIEKSTEITQLTKEVEKIKTFAEKTELIETSIEKSGMAKNAINPDDSELDEVLFHVKIINEDSPEFIDVVHDDSKIITKTISDYNLAVLERTISAKVFIEELNVEQDRVLSITPFMDFINHSAKIPKVVLKPLDVLYEEMVDESSVDTVIEASITKPKNNLKSPSNSQKSAAKKDKIDNRNQNEKPKPKQAQHKTEAASKSDLTSSKASKKTISFEQYKNKQNKKNIELEEKVINKINADSDDKKVNIEEDSLMIFAVTGNEKDSKKEIAAVDTNSKKRKAESGSPKSTAEKRAKPNDKHALLKSVDVDQFLSKLYGPSNREC